MNDSPRMVDQGKMSNAELSAITNRTFTEMSITYANLYRSNPKNFITCFLRYQSIRSCSAWIVHTYKQIGAFEECKQTGKDFTGYCDKLKIDQKWKRVLAELLLIIYSLLNG